MANSIEDSLPDHATWVNTILVSTPQSDPQEHQEALMQPEQEEIVQENADARVVRNRKKKHRGWNVRIRGANGKVNLERIDIKGVFKLPIGKRIVVDWNHRDQPIDESGGLLSRYLGYIARNSEMLPIGYEKWSAVPQHYKDHVWAYITRKFEVNDARHKNYIFKSLGKKWRDYRYNLYKMRNQYKKSQHSNRGCMYYGRPFNLVSDDQWDDFVNYRARSNIKTKATQNTKNCKSLTMHHTLGSKSFARLENEMQKDKKDEPVTRVELFEVAYTKKDGSFVNEKAKKNHEKLVIESQDLSDNDAYIRVFGKEHPGYVRGLGLGAVKTQIYGSSSSSGSMPHSSGPQVEIDAMKEEIKQLKEQIAMLTRQLTGHNPNFMPNQHTNMESPALSSSSQDT